MNKGEENTLVLNINTIQTYTKIINTLKNNGRTWNQASFPVIADMDEWLMTYNKKAMNKNTITK